MKSRNHIYLLFIAAFVLSACSKSSNNTPTPVTKKDTTTTVLTPVWETNADVYFVGTFNSGSPNNHNSPTVWKNGAATTLTDGTSSIDATPNAIAVSGSDIYILGYTSTRGVYWKNGVLSYLSNTNIESRGYSVWVNGNDSYIAGMLGDNATIWKNGIPKTIANPDSLTSLLYAFAITVSGSDVYVAGFKGSNGNNINTYYVPIYIKNAVQVSLDNFYTTSFINGIAVSGNDVYVIGNTGSGAAIWKNGVITLLNSNKYVPSSALAIAIKGTDVYVAGYINLTPTVWKNGVASSLKPDQVITPANIGMAIAGDNIYVAGATTFAGNSLYWRNGIAYPYSKVTGNIYGIAIAPR